MWEKEESLRGGLFAQTLCLSGSTGRVTRGHGEDDATMRWTFL